MIGTVETRQFDVVVGGGVAVRGDEWIPQSPSETVVLMLHGAGQTRHSWKSTGVRLAEVGEHVFALDTRGHGDSDWAPDGDYALPTLIDDVITVIGRLGKPAIIIGASMGGLTGIGVADAAGPQRVTGLVLVDVVPRYEKRGSKRIRDFMVGNETGFGSVDEAADAVAAYLPHQRRPDSSEGLKRNLRQHEDGRWHWHWDPRFLSRPGDDPEARIAALEVAAARLSIPVLLVRGKLSDVVSREAAEQFGTVVPRLQVVHLDGAAHTAAADDNDAFTQTVTDFVARGHGT